MVLSAPIHQLKRKARLMSRTERIPLHAALDRIAAEEGYRSWSLLAAKQPGMTSVRALWPLLEPGDLVLIAGRPGQGKTLASLALLAEAMRAGHRGVFLTLEYTPADVLSRLRAINIEPSDFTDLFDCDCSDAISAGYIVQRLADAPRGTVAVIDYLQLLDQRRDTPELALQIKTLQAFARERGGDPRLPVADRSFLRRLGQAVPRNRGYTVAQPARPRPVRQDLLREPGRGALPGSGLRQAASRKAKAALSGGLSRFSRARGAYSKRPLAWASIV